MNNPADIDARESNRIVMLDALRGLALAGILLLHHIEHFDFYKPPLFRPDWLVNLDKAVWDHAFLFFSGKAFALFSLLFGFSYWIIYENAQKRGDTYFYRHFWRMALLFAFGAVHVVFFRGDILMMYAVLGLPLVFTRYLSNKWILGIAFMCLINPINVYTIVAYFSNFPVYDYYLAYPTFDMNKVLAEGSFIELVKANFTAGYQSSLVWTWNVGRYPAIFGLFWLGVYFAKTKSFTERSLTFWYKILTTSLLVWFCFDIVHDGYLVKAPKDTPHKLLRSIVDSYTKLAMMFAILSAFIITWRHNDGKVVGSKLSSFGRMGLTNYILMSVIGAILYFGWGFALHKYIGASATLLIGIAALLFQMKLSEFWLSRYDQGPLEGLWRKATWVLKKVPHHLA